MIVAHSLRRAIGDDGRWLGVLALLAGIELVWWAAAISLWIWLAARVLAPRAAPFVFAYAIFMWVASIQLGWHYASDGLAAVFGMGAIWWLSGRLGAKT